MSFTFTVPGRPQQKGSKTRLGRAVVDDNPRAKHWQYVVEQTAREHWTPAVIDGPCAVSLEFFFTRPRYHYGTGRNAELIKTQYLDAQMVTTPDIDKLARTVLDGLAGVVFIDDSRVCRLGVGKSYGDPERVEVEIVVL